MLFRSEGFNMIEQSVLNICLDEVNFSVPQVKQEEDLISAMKLLKVIYVCSKSIWYDDKSLDSERNRLKETDFLNTKIERLSKKQLQDPLQIISLSITPWVKAISSQCPFLLTQKTRILILRLCSFDKIRSFHYVAEYIKGSHSLSIPMSGTRKLQRIKLKINRKDILESGIAIMNGYEGNRAYLEFDFPDENGSGLGPTLEFF